VTTAFQLRVAATCDRLARELSDLADSSRVAGLDAAAATIRSVSDAMARLAYDAAKADATVPLARISRDTGTAARALRQVAKDLHHVDIALETAAEAAAVELSKLCRAALSQTQPIE
jgi:hypothetical protein